MIVGEKGQENNVISISFVLQNSEILIIFTLCYM